MQALVPTNDETGEIAGGQVGESSRELNRSLRDVAQGREQMVDSSSFPSFPSVNQVVGHEETKATKEDRQLIDPPLPMGSKLNIPLWRMTFAQKTLVIIRHTVRFARCGVTSLIR